jgi:hypothetical protein
MNTDNENKIDRFCQFFSGQVASIDTGDFSGSPNVYRRLLLCCVFDALAKTAFPAEPKNSERFTRLIRDYGAWPDCHRVSLPHLRKLLSLPEALKDPAFADVRAFVESLPSQPSQNEAFLKADPAFSDIDNLWPKQNGKPVKLRVKHRNLWAKSIRHDALFYEFRNNLVHEFNAEEARGLPTHAEPYYLRGRMYYTTEFIRTLVVNVIKNLEQHLRNDNINPHDSFIYGPYVIPELNSP